MNEKKLLQIFFYSGILMLLIYAIFAVVFHGAHFADGADTFIRLLSGKNFTFIDPIRGHTVFVHNIFALFGIKAGIRDISILSRLNTLGFAVNNILGWTVAIAYSYKIKRLDYLLYTLMMSSLTLILCGFFMHIESISAIGVFWALFLYFLNYNSKESSSLAKAGVVLLCIFSTRLHDSFIFFSILLLIVLIYRVFKKEVSVDFFIITAGITQLAAFRIAINGVINPRDPINAGNALV